MSFEERASSWAVSLVDALESGDRSKVRVITAAAGILITIIMWVVHLTHPEIFTSFLQVDGWAKLFVGFVLAPPFLGAFGVASFIFSPRLEPEKESESGPMSTYFYQERATMKWKLLIMAGIIAGLNFVLMVVTSGI